jgi:hypothetical protein
MDLLQRNISKRKNRLKMRAEVALNEIFKGKPPSPDVLAENFEREVAKLKMKVCDIQGEPSTVRQAVRRSQRAWHRWVRRGNLRKWSARAKRSVSSSGSCP